MRVSQRLYFTLAPAIIGIFTLAALAYWGQYAHAVPEGLVVAIALAALGSLGLAWFNVRRVVERIERLASNAAPMSRAPAAPDELETIASTVQRLSSVADSAEAERRSHETSQREQAGLLSIASQEALTRLDEIRLPLHILLENHFGDLNENQEEMLGAARAAAEHAGDAFQRIETIAALDLGTVALRHDRIRPADLIAGVMPALVAEGERRQVHVTADVAPAIPALLGDRARLQLALELLLHDRLCRTGPGHELTLQVEAGGRDIVLRIRHGDGPVSAIPEALGRRIFLAHGGSVTEQENSEKSVKMTEIALPRQGPVSWKSL